MWCGAAHQYNIVHDDGNMNACSLIPLNSLDRDTKQISKPDDFNMRGNELVKRWRSDPRFSSWFSKYPLKYLSWFQLTLVPNQYMLRDVNRICSPGDRRKVDMSECGKRIHSVFVKAYKEPGATMIYIFEICIILFVLVQMKYQLRRQKLFHF